MTYFDLKKFILLASVTCIIGCAETDGTTPSTNPGQTPVEVVPTTSPGNPTPGTQTPGTQTPGTQTPGTQTPGTQTPGTQTPGTQTPGTQTQSNCRPDPNPSYPQLVTDEDWARALVAGSVPADVAFPTIAYSCGFPVLTDDNSVIFIHWYTGENWSVAGGLTNWETKPMVAGDGIWSAELPMPADIANTLMPLLP